MKSTILAAVISAGLLWSSMPARETCRPQSCAPVAPSAPTGQVSPVTSELPHWV